MQHDFSTGSAILFYMTLSTEPYKGVRDFYPEDMAVQNYIFDTWKKVAKEFGYQEYSASLLEPAELYRSKGNDEIVNEQMFTFIDRGDREVALRPEMTPTLARMIAAKRKSLKFPLRWFSMPNVFRYEKPQRGRKREHWQLNCDFIGEKDTLAADVEIILLAYKIMKEFGAKDEDFVIKINNRKILEFEMQIAGMSEEETYRLYRILDKKDKITTDEFEIKIKELLKEKASYFMELFNKQVFADVWNKRIPERKQTEAELELGKIIDKLSQNGVKNIVNSITLMRGFDYYTGMVFEVFDTSPENNRSLFGGGRYDNLLEIFGVEPVPTVGFGMGDITIHDFLETHNLRLS